MIAVIDYRAGNAPSVQNALKKLDVPACLAKTPGELELADAILLPGVGSAKATMDSLSELGITAAIRDAVEVKKKPFLGICVGLQALFSRSDEGDVSCFGFIPGEVKRFSVPGLRVPQMGWNRVEFTRDSPLLKGVKEGYFYFVNSYYAAPEDESTVLGRADYGGLFCAVAEKGNIFGTQFHIEKSGEAGLALLKNFAALI